MSANNFSLKLTTWYNQTRFLLPYEILHLPIASINHLSGSTSTKQLLPLGWVSKVL